MNKLIILTFMFFLQIKSYSQSMVLDKENGLTYVPYYLNIYKADSLYLVGDFQTAFSTLDSTFQKYKPLNQDLWYEIETYIKSAYKSGNFKSIKPYLIRAIKDYGVEYLYIDEEIKNMNLLSNSEIDSLKNIYKSKIDNKTRATIIKLNIDDQFFRKKGYVKYKNQIDSTALVCYNEIMELLRQNTCISKSCIGNRKRKESSSLCTLLIHIKKYDYNNELETKIKNLINEGQLPPIDYAAMVDGHEQINNKAQIYYTFGEVEISQNLTEREINNINQKRKEIGLYSIGYMNWRNKKMGL